MPASITPRFFTARAALLLLGAACGTACHATAGGGSLYPLGVENFAAGALPPPGLYGMVFGQHYRADTLKDGAGNSVPLPFSVRADVIAPRLVWVSGKRVAGGDLAFHAIVPLVDLDVSIAGRTQNKTGLGDITTGFSVGWHHSPKLHSLAGLDLFVPSGRHAANDLANIGRHHWAAEPLYVLSYIDPAGFNGDVKLGYLVNRADSSLGYRDGQEAHADYALGWGAGNGWTAGASGYWYRQVTADRAGGSAVADSKGRAFAIGPSVKYASPAGWFITVKWQKEFAVRNRAEGSAFWLKAVFPL
jgi:hypothetical protein